MEDFLHFCVLYKFCIDFIYIYFNIYFCIIIYIYIYMIYNIYYISKVVVNILHLFRTQQIKVTQKETSCIIVCTITSKWGRVWLAFTK